MKDLPNKMSWTELERYCEENPQYKIPTPNDAEMINSDHDSFWVDGLLEDHHIIYTQETQCYRRIHPAMLQSVVLIRKEK